ncbi:hypothetical protein ACFQX9_38015 [Bradyrhizobium sp. GCM10028915]|uniref:hypothetical protein n=1 Tax=Bradyrhizobium sp. GCM10028915 TaxID=3273385 RepID=UPI00360A33E8
MHDIAVIYLYRSAEGEEPVCRFLETYRRHPAGVDHDLYVVFKGFPDEESLARARALFAGISIHSVQIDDSGYDLGAYVRSARIAPNRRLLFLNTFSQILGDNWMQFFDRALSRPGVGVVGATGSWAANTAGVESSLIYVIRRMMGLPARLYQASEHGQASGSRPAAGAMAAIKSAGWAPFEYALRLYRYGRYPNPHLRTNAIMIDRDRFLSLRLPDCKTKSDAHMFESGRRSMTRQILQQKLRPVIVDRHGKVYDIAEWKSSLTFRVSQQQNLLIADNRTADYAQGGAERKQYLERLSWVHPWRWDTYSP